MDVSDISSTLASSDLDEYDRHNIWHPLLDRLCHVLLLVCAWRHYSTKKIWEELHFLVILHWTFFATRNESAFAARTHPLLMSQPPGMTKRERQGSITIDHTQSEKVARQVGTRLSTIGVDHSSHVDHV